MKANADWATLAGNPVRSFITKHAHKEMCKKLSPSIFHINLQYFQKCYEGLSLSIPPENIIKLQVFWCFQRVKKGCGLLNPFMIQHNFWGTAKRREKKLWFQFEKKNFTFFFEVRLGTNWLRDRIQILLLIFRELKRIN